MARERLTSIKLLICIPHPKLPLHQSAFTFTNTHLNTPGHNITLPFIKTFPQAHLWLTISVFHPHHSILFYLIPTHISCHIIYFTFIMMDGSLDDPSWSNTKLLFCLIKLLFISTWGLLPHSALLNTAMPLSGTQFVYLCIFLSRQTGFYPNVAIKTIIIIIIIIRMG